MRTKDIEVGQSYYVRLTEEQAMVYRGAKVHARVIRTGFYYDVEHVTGSRVRGAPFHRTQTSAHPQGVEVEWDEQVVEGLRRHQPHETVHAGRAIVNARAVLFVWPEHY